MIRTRHGNFLDMSNGDGSLDPSGQKPEKKSLYPNLENGDLAVSYEGLYTNEARGGDFCSGIIGDTASDTI